MADVGRFISDHRRNQTRTRLYARRDGEATMNRGDLTTTDWRKAKTLPQSSVMVANVSAMAFFFFHILFFVYYSASLSYFLYFSFSSSLSSSPSSDLSVMERAKILKSSSAVVSPSRISASVKNGRRRTALIGVQSCCFFDLTRSSPTARRSTSDIGRRFFDVHGEGDVDIDRNGRR